MLRPLRLRMRNSSKWTWTGCDHPLPALDRPSLRSSSFWNAKRKRVQSMNLSLMTHWSSSVSNSNDRWTRGVSVPMSGSAIGANTASLADAGTLGNARGSGSNAAVGHDGADPELASARRPCRPRRMRPDGPRPLSCSRRFSRMIRVAPKRSAIVLKSMMTSLRSATAMRKLVAWTGRPSRLPSLAITHSGIDWRRLSRLVRNSW